MRALVIFNDSLEQAIKYGRTFENYHYEAMKSTQDFNNWHKLSNGETPELGINAEMYIYGQHRIFNVITKKK